MKEDGDDDDVVGAIDSGGVRWVGGPVSVPALLDAAPYHALLCYAARPLPGPLMDDACPLMAG